MICLDNTDTLEGGASVNAVIDYTVHGLVGATFTQIAAGQLSDTDPSVLYTAGAAVSIISIILVNTHSAAVSVNLYLDPANGGNPRRLIPKNLELGIGYSLHYDGSKITVMNASGNILSVQSGHKLTHQDGGSDEISVQGLSGLLADDQHILDAEVVDLIYPVGSIYISTLSTNPGTLFGVGTWAAFGAGKVLVGLDAAQAEFDTVEETGGEKTHQLTNAELASHTHEQDSQTRVNLAGSTQQYTDVSGSQYANTEAAEGAPKTYVAHSGSDTPHNNLQPYIVVYMWKRTA